MQANPYTGRADYTFWRRTMAGRPMQDVDPVGKAAFRISEHDKVATAGSCFAQHIARTLVRLGFSYLVTEHAASGDDEAGGYGVFPARFGNIYTTRQLLQLFRRAYSVFDPHDVCWRRKDGRYVDPFRPQVEVAGFATPRALHEDVQRHLAAVREMFETCDVFIFTLGLTEAWVSRRDGAVFPLAPGVVTNNQPAAFYGFKNFTVSEVEADLLAFIDLLRLINPTVRIILTVSPVALMATYEDRHVLVSTVYSKSVLRVVAGSVSAARANVAYFPSYEVITGPHGGRAMYQDDLREVRPEAVQHVMGLFAKHYLGGGPEPVPVLPTAPEAPPVLEAGVLKAFLDTQAVICDEEALDPV